MRSIFSSYANQINKLEREEKELKKKKILIKKWEEIDKKYKNISKDFFQNEPLMFKRFVEEEAEEYGIIIDYLRPQQKSKEFFEEVELKLNVVSTYENLINFVKDIEDKNIITKKLTITGSSPKKKIEMELKTIILKE
jgi:Tfp pilus assembly protein PilO